MNFQSVRLRLLKKYRNYKEEDIPIIVSIFLEEYQNCDVDEIPTMISDYLMLEMRNLPYVGYYDETDEDEEENEENFYSHDVSQVVLQDSNSFEHEPMKNSIGLECLHSDFVDSMVEVVQESEIELDLEAEKSAAAPVLDEQNVSCQEFNDIVDHNDIIKELQEVLGIDDQKLEELVQGGFREEQILNAEMDKFYLANEEQAQAEIFGENDPITMESKSGLMSKCLPCTSEFSMLNDPKPPHEFLKEKTFSGGMVKFNIGHELMNKMFNFGNLASLDKTSESVFIHYFEEPPDCFSSVKNDFCLRVVLTSLLVESLEVWKVHTLVTSISLRMWSKNDKSKDNVLKNEYEVKCEKITSSHKETIVWELEPD